MAEDIPLAVRKLVLARDNHKCRWCGRANGMSLHLHHIVYRSGGGKHVPENLITLCAVDHAHAHSDKNAYQDLLLEVVGMEPNVTVLQLMRWQHSGLVTKKLVGPIGRLLDLGSVTAPPHAGIRPPSPLEDDNDAALCEPRDGESHPDRAAPAARTVGGAEPPRRFFHE